MALVRIIFIKDHVIIYDVHYVITQFQFPGVHLLPPASDHLYSLILSLATTILLSLYFAYIHIILSCHASLLAHVGPMGCLSGHARVYGFSPFRASAERGSGSALSVNLCSSIYHTISTHFLCPYNNHKLKVYSAEHCSHCTKKTKHQEKKEKTDRSSAWI